MHPIAVLCGGLGTRLYPLTATIPKALAPVLGTPFIDHLLALLSRNGLRQVVLCVNHFGEMIEAHVGNGERFGLSVRYSYDGKEQLGTAGAIRRALPLLGDTFFLTFGDSYLSCDFASVQKVYDDSGFDALMTIFRNFGDFAPSNVRVVDGRLDSYEKRTTDRSYEYIDYGLSLFRSAAFATLPGERPIDLSIVIQKLIAMGGMIPFEVEERYYEVGSLAGISDLERYLSRDARDASE